MGDYIITSLSKDHKVPSVSMKMTRDKPGFVALTLPVCSVHVERELGCHAQCVGELRLARAEFSEDLRDAHRLDAPSNQRVQLRAARRHLDHSLSSHPFTALAWRMLSTSRPVQNTPVVYISADVENRTSMVFAT